MKTLLWIALFAGAGCFVITLTPNWKYTMITDEFEDCILRRVANLRKAGLLTESLKLSTQCAADQDRKLAEEFGTTDINQMPEPLW